MHLEPCVALHTYVSLFATAGYHCLTRRAVHYRLASSQTYRILDLLPSRLSTKFQCHLADHLLDVVVIYRFLHPGGVGPLLVVLPLCEQSK